MKRCSQGHFYDSSLSECPHCSLSGGFNMNPTQPLSTSDAKAGVTVPLTNPGSNGLTVPKRNSSLVGILGGFPETPNPEVDFEGEKTVGYFKEMAKEPVVGWLVCIEGNHFGEDFRLKAGRNFLGRVSSMDISISGDKTVSREKHAIVVYEPKQHLFLVQPGESKELCYLNDEVVLGSQIIKFNDILTVGETRLMFFPCCSKEFNWDMVKKQNESKDD